VVIRSNMLLRLLAAGLDNQRAFILSEEIYRAAQRDPFRVVVADPPWPFGDKLPGPGRGAAKHYGLLNLDDIRDRNFVGGDLLRTPGIHTEPCVADDAYLFLWRVSAGADIDAPTMVEEAYTVARAWGFAPKTELIWRKTTEKNGKRHFGMGWHLRNEHEACIVAVRGRPKPLARNIRSVFDAPASRVHSTKPDEFYADVVEKMSDGPYLELFARRRRDGWTCIGEELA